MSLKSTQLQYGRMAQIFHWVSAVLIILMMPLGFLMQGASDEATKLFLYQVHAIGGGAVLFLTLLRVGWRWFEPTPDPPADLSPMHQLGLKITHILLYVVLLGLAVSGVGLLLISGLGEILSGAVDASIPADFSQFSPRIVHGLTARLYIALLLAHVGGVILHQVTKTDVLKRMGWSLSKA